MDEFGFNKTSLLLPENPPIYLIIDIMLSNKRKPEVARSPPSLSVKISPLLSLSVILPFMSFKSFKLQSNIHIIFIRHAAIKMWQ